MPNIPVNNSGQLLIPGQSATGSFSGFFVCSISESALANLNAHFTGLKDGNGGNLISSSGTFFPAGSYVPIIIISASLHTTSCPIILFT